MEYFFENILWLFNISVGFWIYPIEFDMLKFEAWSCFF